MVEKVRTSVESFYSDAAKNPQAELCCPVTRKDVDTSHIPDDILGISYGCGSPVSEAGVKPGDTVLDLGSGVGIDCFIASRVVGSSGSVIGVDMTDDMLKRAVDAKESVGEKLGYANVDFRKGFLEEVPVDDETVDVVLSNCVINLSGDKEKVFGEIYRVLKDRGSFTIADIVSEKDVPQEMQDDKTLWGECISGALKEKEFTRLARGAGFYGINVTSRYLYREVKGLRFDSITISGYKYVKKPECAFVGQYAIYNGPMTSVRDDDGHDYPAGMPVEVCTDTAEKLSSDPYRASFTVIDATGDLAGSCDPVDGGSGSGCC